MSIGSPANWTAYSSTACTMFQDTFVTCITSILVGASAYGVVMSTSTCVVQNMPASTMSGDQSRLAVPSCHPAPALPTKKTEPTMTEAPWCTNYTTRILSNPAAQTTITRTHAHTKHTRVKHMHTQPCKHTTHTHTVGPRLEVPDWETPGVPRGSALGDNSG